jgi:SAM-dependent methyltransferase
MDIKNSWQLVEWWEPETGFFGEFYKKWDNSYNWYLIEKKQSLTERTQTEIKWVIKFLWGITKILDCPCWYGRHSIGLLEKWYNVTSVDINNYFLDLARKEAIEKWLNSDFRRESMLRLKFEDEFDAVINMFYSFWFFKTDEENFKVLQNFYNSLKKWGKFLMHTDVNIPRILNGKYKEDETRNLVNWWELRIIDNYNKITKRIEWAWIIDWTRKDYSVRVYTKEEFEELCLKVGFSSVKTYWNWEWNDYSEDSEDMIIIAIK